MVRERADERDLRRVERVRVARERAQRSEDLIAGREGRDDHRHDPEVVDRAVGVRRVPEGRVVAVVVRHHDGAFGHRAPEHADARRKIDRADPFARLGALDAGVVGELQVPGRGVDEVDHRAVGIEQLGGLRDRGRQQVVKDALAAVRVDHPVGLRAGPPLRARRAFRAVGRVRARRRVTRQAWLLRTSRGGRGAHGWVRAYAAPPNVEHRRSAM
jgi:hypothetical protein